MTLKFQALKSLGQLSEREPVIVVSPSEQDPLEFQRLQARVSTLSSGDYSVAGLESVFSVERKTISDLVSCCTGCVATALRDCSLSA